MLQRFQVPESSDSESESASPVNKRRRVRSPSSSSSSSGDDKVTELSMPSGLMLSQLVAMNEGNTAADDSVYAKNAVKPDRIKEVLKEPCCAKQCKRGLHWKLVLRMVMFFWALPKCSQDCVLWSMQQCHVSNDEDDESGSDSSSTSQQRRRISWSVEGQG